MSSEFPPLPDKKGSAEVCPRPQIKTPRIDECKCAKRRSERPESLTATPLRDYSVLAVHQCGEGSLPMRRPGRALVMAHGQA